MLRLASIMRYASLGLARRLSRITLWLELGCLILSYLRKLLKFRWLETWLLCRFTDWWDIHLLGL